MKIRPSFLAALLAATTVGATAVAQDRQQLEEARRQYQQDREYCRSGQSEQDVQTCLEEAAAAYAEYRRDPGWYEPTGRTTQGEDAQAMPPARADRG